MSECLRCGGSMLREYQYGCEHVTREDIRERLRGEVTSVQLLTAKTGGGTEVVWQAFGAGTLPRHHPTREGAIELVLELGTLLNAPPDPPGTRPPGWSL